MEIPGVHVLYSVYLANFTDLSVIYCNILIGVSYFERKSSEFDDYESYNNSNTGVPFEIRQLSSTASYMYL